MATWSEETIQVVDFQSNKAPFHLMVSDWQYLKIFALYNFMSGRKCQLQQLNTYSGWKFNDVDAFRRCLAAVIVYHFGLNLFLVTRGKLFK